MSLPSVHLRYSFEDYRPSQTNKMALSLVGQFVPADEWSFTVGNRKAPSHLIYTSYRTTNHATVQSRYIGSFRLAYGQPYLHGYSNFTESRAETASESL